MNLRISETSESESTGRMMIIPESPRRLSSDSEGGPSPTVSGCPAVTVPAAGLPVSDRRPRARGAAPGPRSLIGPGPGERPLPGPGERQ